MFKNKSKFNRTLYIGIDSNYEKFEVDGHVFNHVMELEQEIRDLRYKNSELEKELKAIKPVVERKDYKPALSEDCWNCIYVVKSTFNSNILGCRKDNVCEDYKPEEK